MFGMTLDDDDEFQSTLRRTERQITSSLLTFHIIFQSTLRRTERQEPLLQYHQVCYFNPRSDERSDYQCKSSKYLPNLFNPRSDERSDLIIILCAYCCGISIHAPTNGATTCLTCSLCCGKFQSTLRRTERRYLQKSRLLRLRISIHAPTNGATVM